MMKYKIIMLVGAGTLASIVRIWFNDAGKGATFFLNYYSRGNAFMGKGWGGVETFD